MPNYAPGMSLMLHVTNVSMQTMMYMKAGGHELSSGKHVRMYSTCRI